MDMPWWIAALVALVVFVIFETRGKLYPGSQDTLSIGIRRLGQRYPLSIFLMGCFVGGLAIHLWACLCAMK
jgi:hypothetical protein